MMSVFRVMLDADLTASPARGGYSAPVPGRGKVARMAKYLFQAALTAEGLRGVLKEGGSARREVVRKAIEGLGGSLEAFYFGFGDKDVYVLADLPDNSAAAAFSTQTSSSGTVSVSTTVLITPEEMDAASKQRVDWRAPGA